MATVESESDAGVRTAKPHISASQLESYCRCGEAYRRRYIEKEIIAPSIALVKGKGFHKGAEHNMRQKIASRVDLPVDDIVGAAVAEYELHAKDCESNSLTIGQEKDSLVRLAELHAKEQAPDYQPVIVEQSVRIELPNSNRDLLGIIDLADDKGRVTDFKTSGKRKNQAEADSSVQLSVYAIGYHAALGAPPKELRLDVLVNNKKPSRQIITTERGISDINALAHRIETVTSAIDAGVFAPATPGAWWCSEKMCGYYRSCPYVNPERKALSTEE
jgi:RecB family exonuclease